MCGVESTRALRFQELMAISVVTRNLCSPLVPIGMFAMPAYADASPASTPRM